jgi:hypothetical protein
VPLPAHRPRTVESVADLEAQAESFRVKVEQARARYDDLITGRGPWGDDSGLTAKVAKAADDLHLAESGLRSSLRLLTIAREAAQEGTKP